MYRPPIKFLCSQLLHRFVLILFRWVDEYLISKSGIKVLRQLRDCWSLMGQRRGEDGAAHLKSSLRCWWYHGWLARRTGTSGFLCVQSSWWRVFSLLGCQQATSTLSSLVRPCGLCSEERMKAITSPITREIPENIKEQKSRELSHYRGIWWREPFSGEQLAEHLIMLWGAEFYCLGEAFFL